MTRLGEVASVGAGAVVGRAMGFPRPRNRVSVVRGVEVPMRDAVVLLADHYAPRVSGPRPTVLVRSPYGRGATTGLLLARRIAAMGYHALLQSVRGTYGSGGTLEPMVQEASDGHDTVAWLREQDWFDGRLGTYGGSYMGFVQWALVADPPPELKAMVVLQAPHDFSIVWQDGPFELMNFVGWTDAVSTQEEARGLRKLAHAMTAARRLGPVMNELPLSRITDHIGDDRAPWLADWLNESDPTSEYWRPYDHSSALEAIEVPTLIESGWQDLFLDQTLRQYQALARRGVPTKLVVGPWAHLNANQGLFMQHGIKWFDAYLDDAAPNRRTDDAPVLVRVGSSKQWRELQSWPPPAQERVLFLRAGGSLDPEASTSADESTAYTYDLADPTPAVGGRIIAPTAAGSRDNRKLERRSDVITFTSDILDANIDVIGVPTVELYVTADNPNIDLFARLCDVDGKGRSFNVSDRITRLSGEPEGDGDVRLVRLELAATAHEFRAGHRFRLQIAGGAHPRYSRNSGGAALADMPTTKSTRHIHHSSTHPSRVVLPVVVS